MAVRKDMRKVTDKERAEIIRLHGERLGRNEIARSLGRAQRTISLICAEEGLVFDVTMTEEATRHRMANLAERRALLAEALQGDAERLTEQMWQPAKVYNFGGKDNTYEERDVDEPPTMDKKALMIAASAAIDRSLKLVPPESTTGEGAARSVLGELAAAFQQVADSPGEAEPGEG
ncbi:helix-turn-helix domain-containing protein [Streptomyces sp. NPDC055059]